MNYGYFQIQLAFSNRLRAYHRLLSTFFNISNTSKTDKVAKYFFTPVPVIDAGDSRSFATFFKHNLPLV